LTGLPAPGTSRTIELSTVFGEGRLVLPRGIPIRIEASAAFANHPLPHGNNVVFGNEHQSEN
jgi:hypothetical protein